MISQILVSVDESEHSEKALNAAVELARQCGAKLMIVNVMEDFGDAAMVWMEIQQNRLSGLLKRKMQTLLS